MTDITHKANILSVKNIEVIYDHVILVLKGVSLDVPEGSIVALLGGNGAGKSTTLKSISNLLGAERGNVTKGSIIFKDDRIDQLNPSTVVKKGIVQVMEGRHCFAHLTVEENLLTGAFTRRVSRKEIADSLERVYAYFPRLKQRRSSLAGFTSGGEQQMKGVSLDVPEGSIVALLGGNGAGKSTTLKSISNLLGAERGNVTKGSIIFKDDRIDQLNPSTVVKKGIVQVMEGRHCFAHLTVEENLLTGAFTRRVSRKEIADSLERVYAYFPRLKQRRSSLAGFTSGGEQQMTAVGRALMAKPKMILLDEPSMGLAPQIVAEIFEIVQDLNKKENVSFLLAEQNTTVALRHADYGYILENGRIVMDGPAHELANNEDVKEFYLGISGAGRKNFKDGKHYRRRKRWLA